MSQALAEPAEPVHPETAAARRVRDRLVTDLVRRARLGDQTAWEDLVEQFSSLLWWVARQAGLTENDGADAVQVTWLRCFEHLHDIKEPARLPAWLITTCRRESLRIRQLARRFPPTDSLAAASIMAMSSASLVSSVSPLSPMSSLTAEDDPAAEVVMAAERNAVIREAIASLPERQRKLLSALMEDDSNTSYANVAASLEMPISSIGPTRARALRRLRRDPRVAQLR
jgi:RNA polymerase sigma factor (sigma-70 family)